MATLAPPVDLDAVAAFFADFPPFRKHGITEPPRLRANVANLVGQDWPGLERGQAELAAWLERATEEYLAAVETGRREEVGPLVRALCEPGLLRLGRRVRGPVAKHLVPGGNRELGRRKLHLLPDGSYHSCERTGHGMSIGSVRQEIRPDRVQRLQNRFHSAVAGRGSGN